MSATRDAAIARIGRVADALAGIREQLVFIGASTLPLLVEVDSRFAAPRVTKDVDAVAATASYTARARLEEALRAAGFRHVIGGHAGRFASANGEIFDLSFAGDHVGASGSAVDLVAIETALVHSGPPQFRHVSAVGLFIMKVAAFFDRGVARPFESKDLADLTVLLVGHSALVDEALMATASARQLLVDAAERLLALDGLEDAMRSHFRDRRPITPDTPDLLVRECVQVLGRIGSSS